MKEIKDLTFEEFVRSNKLALVDFWAEWCHPCRILSPIVEELSFEYAGKIAFGKLNVDENPATAAKFMIMSIPTLVLFKDGKEIERSVGALPKDNIKKIINKHLQETF